MLARDVLKREPAHQQRSPDALRVEFRRFFAVAAMGDYVNHSSKKFQTVPVVKTVLELFGTTMHFPEKLRRLMRSRGCTQASLGEVLDLSHRAVGKWLAGHSSPNPTTAMNLAQYFGVPVDLLLDDTKILPEAAFASPPASAGFDQLKQRIADEYYVPSAGEMNALPSAEALALSEFLEETGRRLLERAALYRERLGTPAHKPTTPAKK